MSSEQRSGMSRRSFVGRTGLVAGGLIAGTAGSVHAGEAPAASAGSGPLPTRVLGKTEVPVTTLTLGTAPCGISPKIPPREIADIVNHAVDLGITSIDTAPAYKQSEEGIGLALGRRRKEVFLATKALANTVKEAEESFSESLELLNTDFVDLLYYHSIGTQDLQGTFEPDGVFTWLLKQKKAGKCRFIGISGHNRPHRFPRFLETGEVDVLLVTLNFVDRHIYDFEEKVLPAARKHNVGVVAMKVFGGARRQGGSYANPKSPPEMPLEHLETAVRYALGLPGVATLNLGVHNKQQLDRNVEMIRRFKPLSDEQQEKLTALGRRLAAEWGPRFGPVAEEEEEA